MLRLLQSGNSRQSRVVPKSFLFRSTEQGAAGNLVWDRGHRFEENSTARMPVLLQPQNFDAWLAGSAGPELLKPAPDDYLQVWPVSRRVNSSRAPSDDPTLIERTAV